MFLVRDVLYCRPGKARAIVDIFVALSKMGEQIASGRCRS